MDLKLTAERPNEAPQGGNHVIFALLDARNLSLGKTRGLRELGLRDAELLSERLEIQFDDLLLDPRCVGRLRLGGQWAACLHVRPGLQLPVSHHLPPQSLPDTPSGSFRP